MRLIFIFIVLLGTFSFAEQTKRVPLSAKLQDDIIPHFFVTDIGGNDFYRDDFKKHLKPGTKRVVLSFFTTWCIVCKENFVIMKENAAELEKNGVQVFLINIGSDDFGKIAKLVKETAGDSFQFFSKKREDFLEKEFGLEIFYPTNIILDADLRILSVLSGKLGSDFPEVFWSNL